ncbi:WD40-repeat-containing domain protein [Rhizoctonia solani]|nr:WD40-repeat-containing domain protein [Rhizoctonia solani]
MYSFLSFWNSLAWTEPQSEPEPEPEPEPGPNQSQIDQAGRAGYIYSVAFSPDGKSVVSGSWDKTIRIWDAQSLSPIGVPWRGHTGVITSVAFSPLGDMLVSGSWDQTIRLWDTNTGRQVGEPLEGHDGDVNSVAFSPGTNFIASGSDDRTVRLWDAKHGAPVSDPFKGHSYLLYSVVFSPDGSRIASGSADNTIRIWDVEYETTVVGPLQKHTQAVRSVSFSPDGSQVISGSDDKTLLLWDARGGSIIGKPFEGHANWVSSVSFSPSGKYVASGSDDKTVRVWDIRMCREVYKPFAQHTDTVDSVAFSPCGGRIVSGSYDETIKIWDIQVNHSDVERDPQIMTEDGTEKLEVAGTEAINKHMSTQEMFELLLRHGCIDLSSKMNAKQDTAILASRGGFGDIWKGQLYDGTKVAIKAWRKSLVEQCDYKSLKRATREIHYWSKLKHENIHRLMGVVIFMDHSLGMVSEWMDNGNLHEYLRKNSHVDQFQLSIHVASGLAYMHTYDMVHGDLKALNVLVSSNGVAKLTDFGLSAMSETSLAFSTTTTSQAGSIRWMSPEILLEKSPKSKPSDVYALGMTILETFTRTVPYPHCVREFEVLLAVQQEILPTRPTNQIKEDERGNQTWDLLLSCWARKPDVRPSAKQVLELLTLISIVEV